MAAKKKVQKKRATGKKRYSSSAPTRTAFRPTTPGRDGSYARSDSSGLTGKSQVTQEMIAKRAYEIHASGKGGSQDENWHRAERELRQRI
jgi:hypothetical protein